MRALTVFLLAGCLLLTVAFYSLEQQSPASAEEGFDPIGYRTDETLFLGKPRAAYLEEIEALEDRDIEEFFRQTVYKVEYSLPGYKKTGLNKFKNSFTFYILNKKNIGESKVNFIREILMSLREITEVMPVELKIRNRNIRLFNQVNVQIESLREKEFLNLVNKMKRENNIYNQSLFSGKYCFALVWLDEKLGLIKNSIVSILDKNNSNHYMSCSFEEIIQIYGISNDSNLIKDSILSSNENVVYYHGVDIFILRMLYNKTIENGMNFSDIDKLLRDVISETREWFELCFRTRACE
ncbi:DUF2927 domain-containing protein [Nisaea sp.]|uniref:DUF2927 domain-containing protein n=1 Tax=Nisaea sp. TaxID=2024842 RepID=UPI0032EF9A49